MIRGIGNPLVAAYARCYLCRIGLTVTEIDGNHNYLIENFYDFLSSYNHVSIIEFLNNFFCNMF